ncbi:hypothetical protein B0H63DRAFT_232921 [Podospora didyma]|uniref:Uncharacterized protein n=1 Tax=Podospora didyma TaxID=330526 RepID=A0AAE0KKZ3_9PEZI|nr:hypothetical protein B0H63DRAFT_232921 [Podospora didyma]
MFLLVFVLSPVFGVLFRGRASWQTPFVALHCRCKMRAMQQAVKAAAPPQYYCSFVPTEDPGGTCPSSTRLLFYVKQPTYLLHQQRGNPKKISNCQRLACLSARDRTQFRDEMIHAEANLLETLIGHEKTSHLLWSSRMRCASARLGSCLHQFDATADMQTPPLISLANSGTRLRSSTLEQT